MIPALINPDSYRLHVKLPLHFPLLQFILNAESPDVWLFIANVMIPKKFAGIVILPTNVFCPLLDIVTDDDILIEDVYKFIKSLLLINYSGTLYIVYH